MTINDAHCHFFSSQFFSALASQRATEETVSELCRHLQWDDPGEADVLAERWIAELDAHNIGRAALMASVPGDELSVAEAVAHHPTRFVGFFMVDPSQADAPDRTRRAIDALNLRGICLFPAMHHVPLSDDRVTSIVEIAASRPGVAVFVHCGVLSVGVRKKLGLPSPFDLSRGNPVALQAVATRYPKVPIIVPHFGAGFFREALMLADMCANVHFDTSSSNAWLEYHPGLTLADVFRQALAVAGPDRLLFGSDSSFFPRGWNREIYDRQAAVLGELGISDEVEGKILAGNFDRIFPSL